MITQTCYLLDTNVISDWFDSTKPRHAAVCKKILELPETDMLSTSAVVAGEIQYGISTASSKNGPRLREFSNEFHRKFPSPFPVTHHTACAYGELRACLYEKFAPKKRRGKTLRPEELCDPSSGKELGIQENDLWLAAQAIERNVVLVTNDAMRNIHSVAKYLRVEDWSK